MVRLVPLVAYEAVAQDLVSSSVETERSSTSTSSIKDDDDTSLPTIVVESLRRRSSVRISKDVELAIMEQSIVEDNGDDTDTDKQQQEGDIYNITTSKEQQQTIDPFSKDYVGITASYFSVGLMIGGSISLLYPVLIVKGGAPASLMAASTAIIMLFWSYKIFFGFLSDCFPIFGYKRKPYMIIGWIFCALVLVLLAKEGNDVKPRHLVIMLSLANLGYVWADTAADGAMVMIAHKEPIERRGKTQTFCYSMMKLGQIVVNVVLLFGMRGPEMNCAGYESDLDAECSTDDEVLTRVDSTLIESYPTDWCHQKCSKAMFSWDLSIPTFALNICFVIAASIPMYICLKEDKVKASPTGEFMSKFWVQIQRRACWQVILYGVLSHITIGVHNAAKPGANYVWLSLSTFQQQLMLILEKLAFFISLNLIRRYALNVSWRKMVLCGSCLVLVFNCAYFLIIFDIYRSSLFYMFTDVSTSFMYTLNVFVSLACMVEVAEPNYEAITYQLLAFFPSLNDQDSVAKDTTQVRTEMATLQCLVILLNLSSLLTLPLLPRQKKDTRELVAKGERSAAWGKFVIISVTTFLVYSTFTTFVTVRYHETHGCLKILGGGGCDDDESSIPALCLVSFIFVYCYGTNFYLSYWPILKGDKSFSWSMFI